MRSLLFGAAASALLTATAVLALRGSDPVLAVLAVTAVTLLLTWLAMLHSTGDASGLSAVGPAAAIGLGVVRRLPWSAVLPLLAAQVVGSVAAGLVGLALDDRLAPALIHAQPSLTEAGVGGVIVGLVGVWVVLSVDGGGPDLLSATPPLVAGAVAPLSLLVAFQPAALAGVATAGLLAWDAAGVAAVAVLVTSFVGAHAIGWLVPPEN